MHAFLCKWQKLAVYLWLSSWLWNVLGPAEFLTQLPDLRVGVVTRKETTMVRRAQVGMGTGSEWRTQDVSLDTQIRGECLLNALLIMSPPCLALPKGTHEHCLLPPAWASTVYMESPFLPGQQEGLCSVQRRDMHGIYSGNDMGRNWMVSF
jgi:hypothetical protein